MNLGLFSSSKLEVQLLFLTTTQGILFYRFKLKLYFLHKFTLNSNNLECITKIKWFINVIENISIFIYTNLLIKKLTQFLSARFFFTVYRNKD